jgi:peptidoglycan/LPS O-acetylase OafA/YrhL
MSSERTETLIEAAPGSPSRPSFESRRLDREGEAPAEPRSGLAEALAFPGSLVPGSAGASPSRGSRPPLETGWGTRTAAAPSWLAAGRIPSLDGLRALAILLVIFAHSHFPGDHLLPLRVLRGRSGFLGVQVFFVLSGFLITTLMLREIRRTGKLSLGGFYIRRALRIVPVYTAYLLLVALLQATGHVRLDGRHWLAALTYTVNLLPGSTPWALCHFWSLCVEEHFYLLWPLLVALLPMTWCRKAVPLCLSAALLLRFGLLLLRPGAAIDLLTFTRIDDIAVGCGLAFLAHDDFRRAWLDRFVASRRALAGLLAFFLASQVVCSNLVGGLFLPRGALELSVSLANTVNSLTISVLMWLVLNRPGCFGGRLLNHSLAVWLGVVSYSAYLWHLPVCEWAPAWMGSFPQNLLFIFAAAALSWTCIEKPFLSLKDRLAGQKQRSDVGQAARP